MVRFNTHVMVVFHNDDNNSTVIKYVTSTEGSMAHWDAGEEALKLSESFAKDIVYGLTVNGYIAAVIKVVNGVRLFNPKAETP